MPRRPTPSLDENATPEQAGEASLFCAGYFPECFAGGCRRNGECFSPRGQSRARVLLVLNRMKRRVGWRFEHWLNVAIEAIEKAE